MLTAPLVGFFGKNEHAANHAIGLTVKPMQTGWHLRRALVRRWQGLNTKASPQPPPDLSAPARSHPVLSIRICVRLGYFRLFSPLPFTGSACTQRPVAFPLRRLRCISHFLPQPCPSIPPKNFPLFLSGVVAPVPAGASRPFIFLGERL